MIPTAPHLYAKLRLSNGEDGSSHRERNKERIKTMGSLRDIRSEAVEEDKVRAEMYEQFSSAEWGLSLALACIDPNDWRQYCEWKREKEEKRRARPKKPVSTENYEETYLASVEAYHEELADRRTAGLTEAPVVKAKIARVFEIRRAKEARRARIAELRAKFPNRSTL
jgi:hypothetical protein